LLEEQRGFTRLEIAEILLEEVNDSTGLCIHKRGWTSIHAYAYIKLLERKDLWPKSLSHTSISKVLESAERMPDPIPEELSTKCTYAYKHDVPQYRKERSWRLDTFYESIGLCLYCICFGGISSNCSKASHRC
ncbi:hypothetical protein FocTR4_00010946, partial [Fusarium oxysporum f. sp. cubense]